MGVRRHATAHVGRAVSAKQRVYVLHSAECLTSGRDLRECEYSVALDRGIADPWPWSRWRRVPDRPVRLHIVDGWIMPDLMALRLGLDLLGGGS